MSEEHADAHPETPPPPAPPKEPAKAAPVVTPPAPAKEEPKPLPKRTLDYRPDTDAKRAQTKSFRHLLRAALPTMLLAAALPPSTSLRKWECERMDQGPFGSCTGHGTAQGLAVSCGAAGTPLGFVASPYGIYTNARCMEAAGSAAPLTDSGAMPADVMTGLAQLGVMPIHAPTSDGRYSDVDSDDIDAKPTLAQLEAEAQHLVVGEYRIDETSPDAMDQVAAALAGLHGGPSCAVGIGVFVDTAFMQWTAKKDAGGNTTNPLDAPPDQSDPNGGGHWVAVVGYVKTATGYVFDVVNSWGEAWGDGTGHIQVTDKWLKAAVSDIYALIATLTEAPPPPANDTAKKAA
jgi:hypothetical protein